MKHDTVQREAVDDFTVERDTVKCDVHKFDMVARDTINPGMVERITVEPDIPGCYIYGRVQHSRARLGHRHAEEVEIR